MKYTLDFHKVPTSCGYHCVKEQHIMKTLKTTSILFLFILTPFISQAWDSYKVTVLPLPNGASQWYDVNDAGQACGTYIDNVNWITNQAIV